MTSSRPQISRRTIAKGAAWAVPVIAVGAPVPAMAASGCITGTVIAADQPGYGSDEITMTNTGPGVIPEGSLIYFTLQNLSNADAYFYVGDGRGVFYVSDAYVFPPSGSGMITLQFLADVPAGASVAWSFTLDTGMATRPNWASFTDLEPVGGCGDIQGCTSYTDGQYGFDCMTVLY